MGVKKVLILAAVLGLELRWLATPVPASSDWWDNRFQERFRLTVVNHDLTVLPDGYTVAVTINHLLLVSGNRSRPDGDDIRIVYQTGDDTQELDRVLADGSAWNQDQTTLLFRTQAVIEQTDRAYYLYLNYPEAESPPTDPKEVYALYQDFEALALGVTPPGWGKFGNNLELQAEVSRDQAASGEQSLKLAGNGWAKSVYRQSPVGTDYTASVRFLTLDQAHEGGLYFRSDLTNSFHPALVFQLGGWWYAGGGLRNYKANVSLPQPQAGQWSTLEAKVVGSEIVYLKVNGSEGFSHLSTGWSGEYLGVVFRATKLVYYDDLWVKKAVSVEPTVELGPVEPRSAPRLELTVLGDPEINFGWVLPGEPVTNRLSLDIKTNQPAVKVWVGLEQPLTRSAGGALLSPWDGGKGLGIKLTQDNDYRPLSKSGVFLTELDPAGLEVELPLELILATDHLDPAGSYTGNLVFSVISGSL